MNARPISSKTQTGLARIEAAFNRAKTENRPALMPYYTLGYPNPEISLDVITAIADAGADLIELGVPFSDPLADGPTIQGSTQVALEQGMTVARCLEMTALLRERGVSQALILMGYINPILAYGVERYVTQAAQAGADGLIVPDLPPEEAGELETACKAHELALIYLLSPASPPERIQMAAERTSGFLYLVSLLGVTGARRELPAHLPEFVRRVKAAAKTPTAVGFGISTPEQARQVGQLADGVIIGSALIDAVRKSTEPVRAAREFVSALRAGWVE
jgi:tryptophan synthase alpha chain